MRKMKRLTWDETKITAFQEALVSWYEANKRVLPWRENTEPYRIWVSEIMLQQTKVDTVIPYFNRFMTQFPTMEDFVQADEADILKAWEGLGYYSRVRNLQTAMKQVMADFSGVVPNDLTTILSLKGVGPYTAGAILSIAYNQAEPAVDGNVMRVIARVLEISEDIMKASTRKIFEEVLYQLIDKEHPSAFNQGLMEIGALVCTPTKPMCMLCPLQPFCEAHKNGVETNYPVKIKKVKTKTKELLSIIVVSEDGKIAIEKRPENGLLANMWQFPTIEITKKENDEVAKLQFLHNYGLDVLLKDEPIAHIKHVFSHLIWKMDIRVASLQSAEPNENWYFATEEEMKRLAFPVPYQKMWQAWKDFKGE
ncbi:A/G-specific adenine glycosylase [Listeria monocytogenes]|nr:A/G-specific adenine glycosylase [Listeria monocytogenes]EGK9509941.1 A/G-specific adenine glycosylase [Listeria monocytogenes]